MKKREVLCVYGHSAEETQKIYSTWLRDGESRKIVMLQEGMPLKEQAWQLLLAELQLLLPEHLTEEEKQNAKGLFEELRFWQIGAEALLSDVRDRGKQIVGNLLANLPFLQGSLKASSFANQFKKVPAIICGAGPSLDRHLHLLEQAKESALLFAAGSSLSVLWERGVKPHFAAALDPNPPRQLFLSEATESLPFFFPLRVANWLLSAVKGKKIWAADGISYPLESWLTAQLGLEEPSIEGGWNVATFSMSLAAIMGCDPIILVGVDLSLPQGRSYAEGVDHTYDKERLIETAQGTTKGDFILAADWIAEFKEKHPHLTVCNVAQEAWKIPGVEHNDLSEILLALPKRNLQQSVSDLLHKSEAIDISKNVEEVISSWRKSLANIKKSCEEMLTFFEKHFPFDPRTKGEYALKEVELEEESAYIFLLQPIWEVWRPLFQDTGISEPFSGFHETVQKLLFWKNLIEEVQDAAI